MALAHEQKHRRDQLTDWISRYDPHTEVRPGMAARPNGGHAPNGGYDPTAPRGPFAGSAAKRVHNGFHAQMGNGKDDADPWNSYIDGAELAGARYRDHVQSGSDGGVRTDVGRAFLWVVLAAMAGVDLVLFLSGLLS